MNIPNEDDNKLNQPGMEAEAAGNSSEDSADAPALGELAADDPNNDQKQNRYDVVVNGVGYAVVVTPFIFNEETRYYVSVNAGPTNLFLWDKSMSQIRSLDDSGAILPDGLEQAISDKLMNEEEQKS